MIRRHSSARQESQSPRTKRTLFREIRTEIEILPPFLKSICQDQGPASYSTAGTPPSVLPEQPQLTKRFDRRDKVQGYTKNPQAEQQLQAQSRSSSIVRSEMMGRHGLMLQNTLSFLLTLHELRCFSTFFSSRKNDGRAKKNNIS